MRYTVKAASMATGISESRLRTWERRYGIPSPNRSATGRRLYDDEDLAIIRRMSALVDAGVAASDAAEAARSGGAVAEPPSRQDHELVGRFANAAERFDEDDLISVLRAAVTEMGWADGLDKVIFPAMNRVGIYWETAVLQPSNEHFASELVRRELHAAVRDLPPVSDQTPRVLMACPEDERHDIGLLSLHLLLRSSGVQTVYLGADVPTQDILSAYDSTDSNAICLSATTTIGLASLIRASRAIVGELRLRLFIGGPATSASGAEAAGIRLPLSIKEATQAMLRALGHQPLQDTREEAQP